MSADRVPLWQRSAAALAQGYRNASFSPMDVLESCIARIEAVQPRLNAFVALNDGVWAAARASGERLRAGQPLSPLDGIPVSIKDNLRTADMPTSWGSPALRAHPLESADEWPVKRLRERGALIVGKTNLPEFTLEGYTDNPVFGTTGNPWNPALTPGGSSGGAAASVAAGCTPLALGTDGGGSIRRPASHCGLVGFKPSIGAIARGDGLPGLLLDFEVVGAIARNSEDAQLLFSALRGPCPHDRASLAWHAAHQPYSNRSLRILYVATLGDAPVDPVIAQSCLSAAQSLGALGHQVDIGPLPVDVAELSSHWPQVGQIGLAALFEQHPEWRDLASPKYRDMATQGAQTPASRLWRILEAVDRLRRDCATFFQDYDIIAMPSAAALPWPATEAYPPEIDGQPVGPRGHAVFTGWINGAGLPAVSVPTAPAAGGLPIGLQLVGAYGHDDTVLALAQAYETLRPWSDRWPAP